jgi:hypothetical protein
MGNDVGTKEGVASGTGNQVSAEFNLFYRWHSCISDRDDKWTQAAYRKMFPGKEPEDLDRPDMMIGLRNWDRSMDADPQKRQYQTFARGEDGMLDDEAMVQCLTESIEDCGGERSNWVPATMLILDRCLWCPQRSQDSSIRGDLGNRPSAQVERCRTQRIP